MLLKVVGTIAYVIEGVVTYEIVLTNMCDGGNVDIWLTCKGNGEGSYTTMDQDPWFTCN